MEEIAPLRATTARAPYPLPTVASAPSAAQPRPPGWLTPAEEEALVALRQRDQEVRREEANRLVAAGVWHRPGIDYECRMGPDGQLYAVKAHPGMVAALGPADSGGERPPPRDAAEEKDDDGDPPGRPLDVSASWAPLPGRGVGPAFLPVLLYLCTVSADRPLVGGVAS